MLIEFNTVSHIFIDCSTGKQLQSIRSVNDLWRKPKPVECVGFVRWPGVMSQESQAYLTTITTTHECLFYIWSAMHSWLELFDFVLILKIAQCSLLVDAPREICVKFQVIRIISSVPASRSKIKKNILKTLILHIIMKSDQLNASKKLYVLINWIIKTHLHCFLNPILQR